MALIASGCEKVMAESSQKTDVAKAALEAAKVELASQEKKMAAEQTRKEEEVMLFDPVLSCDAVLQRCLLLC